MESAIAVLGGAVRETRRMVGWLVFEWVNYFALEVTGFGLTFFVQS
jgi:hypothetical protein